MLDGGTAKISCVLWDISEGGARIAAAHGDALPSVFGLFLTKDGKSRRFCRGRDFHHLSHAQRHGRLSVLISGATSSRDYPRASAALRKSMKFAVFAGSRFDFAT